MVNCPQTDWKYVREANTISLIQHFEDDFLWKVILKILKFRNDPENFHPSSCTILFGVMDSMLHRKTVGILISRLQKKTDDQDLQGQIQDFWNGGSDV